ncbi:uncharacterized protein LOC110431417 [Sorghum bicolor]|uniref:Uncharacterized protein n=1 Tax=Sorghum bicolor TaxID=4558 RepID=A0A194YMB7_SORBI|nr:uncharacterized protein LOC110431417 [Sorghum bicolor]KXG20746.1 hypothetical protein SORBI_3010G247000 [Sorghum bicolor]|eukprot:XP_021306203.1 uncharacterized protein LOC110431417 [Sorghum bicolor]
MRRRRWARAATALSWLAIAVVLQLAAVAEGRSAPSLLPPPRRAHGDGHAHAHAHAHARPRTHSGSGLPPPLTGATTTVRHAVAADVGVGASVRFDAAAGAATRCKSGGRQSESGAAAAGGGACADDDDEKRRIPTGPNPLHNR